MAFNKSAAFYHNYTCMAFNKSAVFYHNYNIYWHYYIPTLLQH